MLTVSEVSFFLSFFLSFFREKATPWTCAENGDIAWDLDAAGMIQGARLLHYLIKEIKMYLNINYITVVIITKHMDHYLR